MDTGGRRAQQREPVQYGRRAMADHRTRAEAGVRGVYGETVGQDRIPGGILDDVRTGRTAVIRPPRRSSRSS